MIYLVDTDVLVEILRNNRVVAEELRVLYRAGHVLCYSPVTKAEIYGGLREQERRVTQVLFREMQCFPIDDRIGEIAGEYLRTYRAQHGVMLADALVAASAVANRAELITFNLRHYPMPEVKVRTVRRTS